MTPDQSLSQPKIHQLDPITASQIAAGEVVERPASVIKELCENALDAGASVIDIEIEQGGIRMMRVRDDGEGMSAGDAEMAFLPHATSKIRDLSDLSVLHSLGFRGEALPSIASVSRVELVTRREDMNDGVKLTLEGGDLVDEVPHGAARGSTFTIRDLFYNTPARYKFLKKDRTETMYITRIVTDLALARPDISFRLVTDGKEKIHTPGNGELLAAIYALFGSQVADEMIEIHPNPGSSVKLSGYLGTPEIARRSRQMQYFNVNQRPFQSPLLARALDQAYEGHLMTRDFPVAVLHLDVSPSLIDVNVHPQKLEIRFWDDNKVFHEALDQMKQALEPLRQQDVRQNPLWREAPGSSDNRDAGPAPSETPQAETSPGTAPRPISGGAYISPEENAVVTPWQPQKLRFEDRAEAPPASYDASLPPEEEGSGGFSLEELRASGLLQSPAERAVAQTNGVREAPAEAEATRRDRGSEMAPEEGETSLFTRLLNEAKYIGQLFRTYLLFELGHELILIDQHAAHEKLLYEYFMERFQSEHELQAQLLLTPLAVTLSAAEIDLLESQAEVVRTLGFEIDAMGPGQVALRAIPASRQHLDPERALRALLDDLHTLDFDVLNRDDESRRHTLATMACKAAVKGHDHLTQVEVEALLQKLAKAHDPWRCPHGRPTVVHIPESDIEKAFQRIVN